MEGVDDEGVVPHSGALTVRRGGRVRQRVGAMSPWWCELGAGGE